MLDLDKIYTPSESADYLNSNERTLERWRTTGTGPEFVKVGRRVGYTGRALRAYVERQTRRFTSESSPTAASLREREAVGATKSARVVDRAKPVAAAGLIRVPAGNGRRDEARARQAQPPSSRNGSSRRRVSR
jgi:hypothetical protein